MTTENHNTSLRGGPVQRFAWQDDGSCVGINIEQFYPDRTQKGRYIPEAKKICATCPVSSTCLNFAIEGRETYGVWGGVDFENEDERRSVYRRRRYEASKKKAAS